MITDEEISQLPEDPELAFVEFEKILRARLHEKEQEVSQEQWGDVGPYQLEYVNKVLAAARAYKIDALTDWKVPSVSDKIADVCRQFSIDVDHFTIQVRIRRASTNRLNSVGLDGNTKAKIHHFIQQIRNTIETADLPEPKRDSLYKKLDGFALEVDKIRTDLQAGMAVYLAICDGIGQGFEKLEPARRWFDSIGNLLGRVKEVEDSLRPALPRLEERRRLETPRKQLTPPKPEGSDLDDEIPF